MEKPNTSELDLWRDSEFGQVDFSDEHLMDDVPEDEPPAPEPEPAPAPEPTPAPPPAPEPEDEGPEEIQLQDGGVIRIEKNRKGWHAALDSGFGGVENFYGKTKNELLVKVMTGKLNATKKIRELNRQVKFGVPESAAPASTPTTPQSSRELTADEVFEIKTKLEANPDLALDEWFQKKTGMKVADLVRLAREGEEAKLNLQMENVTREFLRRTPSYYPDENFENYNALVAYIAKHKIGKTLTDKNQDEVMDLILRKGQWTVQNLEEAFEDLSENHLLVVAPRSVTPAPKPTPAAQPAPTPAPSSERIVRTETRPRASLGIRQNEASPAPSTDKPETPSVEDLSQLSIDELRDLMHKTQKLAVAQRGRR